MAAATAITPTTTTAPATSRVADPIKEEVVVVDTEVIKEEEAIKEEEKADTVDIKEEEVITEARIALVSRVAMIDPFLSPPTSSHERNTSAATTIDPKDTPTQRGLVTTIDLLSNSSNNSSSMDTRAATRNQVDSTNTDRARSHVSRRHNRITRTLSMHLRVLIVSHPLDHSHLRNTLLLPLIRVLTTRLPVLSNNNSSNSSNIFSNIVVLILAIPAFEEVVEMVVAPRIRDIDSLSFFFSLPRFFDLDLIQFPFLWC